MRGNGEKLTLPLEGIEDAVEELLARATKIMYDKAIANREAKTYACRTMDEITAAINEKGDGFVKAMWCGDEACEDAVKEQTGVCSRCIPFEQEQLDTKCVCCGKEAKHMLYWGKAY